MKYPLNPPGDLHIKHEISLERVGDKPILLSGLYEETGRVGDKPILLSGLYEETGQVADKQL